MDEALTFIEQYAAAVYATRMACITERDSDTWRATLAALQDLTIEGGYIDGANRLPSPDESWFADFVQEAEDTHVRKIFQVKQYEVDGQPLYRAYVSNDSGNLWDKLYDRNWFVAKVEGTFKVTGHAIACWDCMCHGQVDGARCGECEGLGWIWLPGSPAVTFSGPPGAVKKMQAPILDEHLAEYEAD